MAEDIPQFAREEKSPEFHFVTDVPQKWVFPNGGEWAFDGAELTDTTLTIHRAEASEKFLLEEWRRRVGGESDGEVELIFVHMITGERIAFKKSVLQQVFGQVIPDRL